MAHLFYIENRVVKPNTEVLLIEPFKSIWERDKSNNKEQALKEFAYIEFYTSKLKSNPYKGYDESIRKDKIILDIIKDPKWREDKLIKEAINKVDLLQKEASQMYTLYLDTLKLKEKLQLFMRSVDLNERTKTNTPVYKPKEITSAMLDIDRVATSLSLLEKKVEEELYVAVKNRSNKEISPFAKPESINGLSKK